MVARHCTNVMKLCNLLCDFAMIRGGNCMACWRSGNRAGIFMKSTYGIILLDISKIYEFFKASHRIIINQ